MMCRVTESNTYLDQQHTHGNTKSAEKVKSLHENDLTKMATTLTELHLLKNGAAAPAAARRASLHDTSTKKQTSNNRCFQRSRTNGQCTDL
jgi:hypothetical protein